MNRTKIEWCDYTWNPITGCLHGCKYCYARKIANRFKNHYPNGFLPTFHANRLYEPLTEKVTGKIFTGSMCDMFGAWMNPKWVSCVFDIMRTSFNQKLNQNFLILTKNPSGIGDLLFGEKGGRYLEKDDYLPNVWLGVTIENNNFVTRIDKLKTNAGNFKKFVSFEPLKGQIDADLSGIDWVIVGAQTNPRELPEVSWVQNIIDNCNAHNIPFFLKNNLLDCDNPNKYKYQNFPRELMRYNDDDNHSPKTHMRCDHHEK